MPRSIHSSFEKVDVTMIEVESLQDFVAENLSLLAPVEHAWSRPTTCPT